jgi:hypothetical protein
MREAGDIFKNMKDMGGDNSTESSNPINVSSSSSDSSLIFRFV